MLWVGDISELLSFAILTSLAQAGSVDTVLVCTMDMRGRLMGKRFQVSSFLANYPEETHCCNYLLTTALEMATPDGYAATSWKAGYGDYVMKPNLLTLRPTIAAWISDSSSLLQGYDDLKILHFRFVSSCLRDADGEQPL